MKRFTKEQLRDYCANRPPAQPNPNDEPHTIVMTTIERAYNEMLVAEQAFSRAIDNFSTALARDEKVRNHPSRTVWSSKCQEFHHHPKWCALMSEVQRGMCGDGVLKIEEVPFYG